MRNDLIADTNPCSTGFFHYLNSSTRSSDQVQRKQQHDQRTHSFIAMRVSTALWSGSLPPARFTSASVRSYTLLTTAWETSGFAPLSGVTETSSGEAESSNTAAFAFARASSRDWPNLRRLWKVSWGLHRLRYKCLSNKAKAAKWQYFEWIEGFTNWKKRTVTAPNFEPFFQKNRHFCVNRPFLGSETLATRFLTPKNPWA